MPIPLIAWGGGALVIWALSRSKARRDAFFEKTTRANTYDTRPVAGSGGRLQTTHQGGDVGLVQKDVGDVTYSPSELASLQSAADQQHGGSLGGSVLLDQMIESGAFVDPFTGGIDWAQILNTIGSSSNIDLNSNPLQQLIDKGLFTEDEAAALAAHSPGLYGWQSKATQARLAAEQASYEASLPSIGVSQALSPDARQALVTEAAFAPMLAPQPVQATTLPTITPSNQSAGVQASPYSTVNLSLFRK
jgi:hypothetical protein